MADELLELNLRRKINTNRSAPPPKRQFKLQGESAYDFSQVPPREKRPYTVHAHNEASSSSSSRSTVCVQVATSSLSTQGGTVQLESSGTENSQGQASLDVPDLQVDERFFNEKDLYFSLLNAEPHNIKISYGIGLFMVIPDLNYDQSHLQVDSLILLERKFASFSDGEQKWILTCSCQPIWSREIRSSFSQYTNTYNDFLNQYPMCVHRKVATVIFGNYDIIHQIPQDYMEALEESELEHGYCGSDDNVEEVTRINGIPVVRVWSADLKLYGLVSFVKKNFFCYCCGKNYCDHTKVVKDLCHRDKEISSRNTAIEELYEISTADQNIDKVINAEKLKCLSFNKIPFSMSTSSMEIFKNGVAKNVKIVNDKLVFIPQDINCRHCGGELDMADPICEQWVAKENAAFVTNTFYGTGMVYYRPCLSCEAVTLYDGLADCVLNMGNYLVGHDVLRSYMHNFLHGKRPLYTFYCVMVDYHRDCGNLNILVDFSYHKLRAAWLSYLNLLDIDFTEGFSCPDCPGDGGPEIVVCDGTSLSFQRRMWSWESNELPKRQGPKKKSGFKDRIFLPDTRARNLLLRYAAGGDVFRMKYQQKLSCVEKTELFRLLKEYPSLHLFLKSLDDGTLKLPKQFRNFVTSLASSSPVCGYIHPNDQVYTLMKDLISGSSIKDDLNKWQDLHNHIPILFEILEQSNQPNVPDTMAPLLHELLDISLYPFENFNAKDVLEFPEREEDLAFFPSLPKCRQRGLFPFDFNKANSAKSCKKTFKGHPSLLPGVFTIYCTHGVCHGFQVMQTNESPNVPFTIFKTRFKRAPKFVIYDNACSLHAYCINRDPLFFKDTIFLVDRLHWNNHTGCSCGYCLDIYPLLKDVNSQANEQANAGLKRIKDQLSYMTADNFMKHCTFYLWNKNHKKGC